MSTSRPPDRTCVACGRTFAWRRKWARDWERVQYCSQACRGRRRSDVDRALEAALRSALAARSGSLCPSEVARAVGGERWRSLMEPTRRAARRLVARGEARILQRGRVVDPSRARGPIRIACA